MKKETEKKRDFVKNYSSSEKKIFLWKVLRFPRRKSVVDSVYSNGLGLPYLACVTCMSLIKNWHLTEGLWQTGNQLGLKLAATEQAIGKNRV